MLVGLSCEPRCGTEIKSGSSVDQNSRFFMISNSSAASTSWSVCGRRVLSSVESYVRRPGVLGFDALATVFLTSLASCLSSMALVRVR